MLIKYGDNRYELAVEELSRYYVRRKYRRCRTYGESPGEAREQATMSAMFFCAAQHPDTFVRRARVNRTESVLS